MGKAESKEFVRSAEAVSKIKELKGIDDVIADCKELQLALM